MDIFLEEIGEVTTTEAALSLLQTTAPYTNILQNAITLASDSHQHQLRKSGEPYIVHPLLVASIVAYLGGDEAMIIAAVLHDVVEDTDITLDEIRDSYGDDVAHLVDGLTKIVQIREENLIPSSVIDEKLIQSALTFQKILIASIKDIRVLVIKLCDRLHNILTLNALKPDKQKRIAEETLVVYAPIAHRLGISKLKNILENRSFYYIFPKEYNQIADYLSTNEQSIRLKLNTFASKIVDLLHQNGLTSENFEIQSRIKHHYSIYSKMQRKGISIDEVLDLLAVRVITKTLKECYLILGILHIHFKPLIARFKDYIALPKDNGYQTIHTTLFDENAIFEIQIRTQEQHQTAELGVAAHWKYKNGGLTPKLEWLQAIQHNSDDIENFYELAKNDLFSEEIAVYSPQGEVFTLPLGATALDFAYAIHTEVGAHAQSAQINKESKPLLTELHSGDMIKIKLAKHPITRCTWINAVKTSKAKHHMKTECAQKLREIDKFTGFNILLSIFKATPQILGAWLKEENLNHHLEKILYNNNLLIDIIMQLESHQKTFLKIKSYKLKPYTFNNIIIYSKYSIGKVEFDYCCHPKSGDDIVVFYKKGKAIIHHKLCDFAHTKIMDNEPMLKGEWIKEGITTYKMVVSLENQQGALANFINFLAKSHANILSLELGKSKHDYAQYCELLAEFQEKSLQTTKEKLQQRYKVIEFTSAKDAYKE
jgi:GTP diphosphokinase / guanosine-3',5'-bis(diphosphate) 3'-diphosphatase